MKRSILMLMAIAVALIFFGCEKETFAPESDPLDQETTTLKAAKEKVEFDGTCIIINHPTKFPPPILNPNSKYKEKWVGVEGEWFDNADDWRVTGKTIWYANYYWEGIPFASNAKVWGKFKLFVGVINDESHADFNPDATPKGIWEVSWHGNITDDGLNAICYANGVGKSGVVKGLTAKWIYTLAYGITPEGVTYPYYVTEGYIK